MVTVKHKSVWGVYPPTKMRNGDNRRQGTSHRVKPGVNEKTNISDYKINTWLLLLPWHQWIRPFKY